MRRNAQGAADKLIVALDFPDARQALALIDRLEGRCRWFKVGLELYLTAGNSIVETLKKRDFSVFLALKYVCSNAYHCDNASAARAVRV